MESLNELTSLAPAVLNSGFDFEVFGGFEYVNFLVLLSLAVSFHHSAPDYRYSTLPVQNISIAGRAIMLAARDRLLSWAKTFEDNMMPIGIGPFSILPRDLTSHRNC